MGSWLCLRSESGHSTDGGNKQGGPSPQRVIPHLQGWGVSQPPFSTPCAKHSPSLQEQGRAQDGLDSPVSPPQPLGLPSRKTLPLPPLYLICTMTWQMWLKKKFQNGKVTTHTHIK